MDTSGGGCVWRWRSCLEWAPGRRRGVAGARRRGVRRRGAAGGRRQAASKALESEGVNCVDLALGSGVLDAAAGSPGPAAVEKVDWVLSHSSRRCSLAHGTAVAAVHSGDLGRLRWLHDRGCPMGFMAALKCALEHAGLAVAQWLVDEAGCELPAAGSNSKSWIFLAQRRQRALKA